MSIRSKITNYKKSKIILNLKKYSNVALFARREEEISRANNSSNKSIKHYLNSKNSNKSYNKSLKLETPSDDISTYALKTISSFKNSFDSFSTKIVFSKNIRLNENNQTQKTINPYFTISSFRPETESNINKRKRNKNKDKSPYKKNIFCLTQNNFKESNIKKEFFNTVNYFSHKNKPILKERENEIKLLRQLNFRQYQRPKINKKEEFLLNSKLNKLDSERYNISVLLNKVREFKYFHYLNEQRKEINKTTLENSKNKIDFLSDKINSLNNMRHIYNNKILNKLGEYSKFIINFKEREKIISDILLNKINNLKKEVKNLQNKIAKKEMEKATILKWVYFLIKMKEKKLVLPTYYNKIIEANFQRKKEKRKTIVPKTVQNQNQFRLSNEVTKKDRSNKIMTRVRLNTFNENINDIIENNKNDNKKKDSKTRIQKIKLVKKSTFFFKKNSLQVSFMKMNGLKNENIFNFEEQPFDNNKFITGFEHLIKEGIDKNEINRVSKYKLFLIYKTPEDLQDRLVELQNENIQLLKQYQSAENKLFAKKIKINEITESMTTKDFNDLNKRIKEREMILIQIKKKNEALIKQYSEENQNLKPKKIIINIKQKKSRSINKKPITQDSIRKELFSKIEHLYELCVNNIEIENNYILNNKNKKNIIFKLKVIEFCIVNLKTKLNFKDKSNLAQYDLIRKIKNDIEHKHKIEKGQILRLQEKEKFRNFQEEIEEKMNKILFLTKRKIVPVYNLENKNKEKRHVSERKLNFEDFMFD